MLNGKSSAEGASTNHDSTPSEWAEWPPKVSDEYVEECRQLRRRGHREPTAMACITRIIHRRPDDADDEFIFRAPGQVREHAIRLLEDVRADLVAKHRTTNGALRWDCLHGEGVLFEIMDYVCSISRSPNRLLALGTALTVIGTLIGRRVMGPTKSGTHLNVGLLADSGAGKNDPLATIPRLLTAATTIGGKGGWQESMLGPSEFASMSAVINSIGQGGAVMLCPMDELGAFLGRILNQRHANGWERGVAKLLRQLFPAFETLPTMQYAERKREIWHDLSVSILGASTPEEFYGALGSAQITDGTLNRFLILHDDDVVEPVEPETDSREVPEALAVKLRALFLMGDSVPPLNLIDPKQKQTPFRIGWHDEDVADVWQAFERHCKVDAPDDQKPFLKRSAEIAARCATIRACGRHYADLHHATVTLADVQFGIKIAQESAHFMIEGARRFMAETEHQRLHKMVLEAVPCTWTPGWKITKAIDGKIDLPVVKRILEALVIAGDVEHRKIESKTKTGHEYRRTRQGY